MAWIGAAGWLVVPIAWETSRILERTREWEGSPRAAYLVGAAAALAAGALMFSLVIVSTASVTRSKQIWLGIGLVGLGLVVSVIAGWAIPVWATLYGVGMLLIVASGCVGTPGRIIGAALLASTAVFLVLSSLEVGAVDSYGDYPAAWSSATWVGTLGAGLGMAVWARTDAGVSAPEPECARLVSNASNSSGLPPQLGCSLRGSPPGPSRSWWASPSPRLWETSGWAW